MPRYIPKARKPPEAKSEIVNKLLTLAFERGLRQSNIAKQMGVYSTAVNNWYCGRNTPTIRLTEELAQALNVKIILIDEEGRQL